MSMESKDSVLSAEFLGTADGERDYKTDIPTETYLGTADGERDEERYVSRMTTVPT